MADSFPRKLRHKLSRLSRPSEARRNWWERTALRLEHLEDRLTPSTFKWVGAGANGNWDTAANWSLVSGSGTFPNAAGDVAQFTNTTATQLTTTLDLPVTVGEIDFGSSQSYTISSSAAANTLTLQATSGSAVLKTLTSPANSGTDIIAAQVLVNAGTPLSATLAQGTLKLNNVSAANPNTVTGTFTVTGGTLEGFSTQTANTDALGTASVVLNGGTFKIDPIPSAFSASGVTGRYFNTGATATNNGTSPAVGQIDYSGTPGATRSDANLNFTSLTTSNLPTGISTNAGSTNTQNNFAVEWAGGLNILTGGSYTFTDQSDDGSQLFIDGVAVVTNNSNTSATSVATTLSAGVHAFDVRYYQGSGGASQVISYNGPDTSGNTVVIAGAASLAASGLFQYASGSTATFTNNVTLNAGITGTIDLTGAAMDATLGTLTTAGTGTLSVTGSFTGRTVNFGNVTLGGTVTLNPTSANLALGAVTDNNSNFAITKTGAGTLNLMAAASMYAGTVALNAGTLVLSNATALGTGGLTVTAGTVLINAAGALGTTINLTTGETLVANTANVLSGAIVNVGPGAVVQGIGANALAGATINLNGGGLSLRADASTSIGGTVNVNSNSSVIDVNRLGLNATNQILSITSLTLGAGVTTLNITGAAGYTLQNSGSFTLPSNVTINTVDANFTFGGALSGAFTATKVGAGTLTFSVDSTSWTGSSGTTLVIQQGTANLITANAGGATGSTVLLQGGTLGLNSAAAVSYQLNVALDPSLGVGTINNPNNFTNTITGTLTLTPSQQLQTTGQNTIIFSTATLTTVTGYYVFNTNGASLQLNGLISGPGTIVKLGGNTLTLGVSGGTTANTYSGGSVVNAGTLQANGVTGGTLNNFGTGTITLNGGQANLFAEASQNNVYTNNIVVAANAAIGFGRNSSSVTNSIIYLTGTLTVGNNTLTFNQNNNYILAISGATTLTGNASIAGSGVVVFSGAIGDGGNGFGITKTAANTVILNGVNTYTGDTHVNAGNLAITSTGKIASNNVYVEPGAIVTLPSATGWFAGTQPSLFVNSSPTALAEVQINYNGALPTIIGGVTPTGGISGGAIALGLNLTLTGGATSINIPALGSNPAIVMTAFAGPVSQAVNLGGIGDGSFFLGAASNITYNGTFMIGSGNIYRLGAGGAQLALASTITLAEAALGTQVLIGTALANGTANLTNGSGTVVLLMNNNTYTGGTVINRGSTLVVGGADATGTGGPLGLSTSPVTVYGNLTAAGSGSFLQMGSTTANVNGTFAFQPGSILTFDNVTTTFQGITAANNNNRWGDSAAINLNASTVQLLGQNAAAATTETVGAVSFTAGSVIASKRGNTGNTVTLTVASLTRGNRGTLTLVTSTAATLGTTAAGGERIVDTAAGTDAATTPVSVNTAAGDTANVDTMTAAYILNGTDNTFVSFNQTGKIGFGNTKFSGLTLTTAGATGVVKLTATAAISSPVSVYALAVIGNFALTGTSTITSGSGGLILQGVTANQTSTPNWTFGTSGTAEALIYTANSSTSFWVFSGSVTTSGGLTKFGQGNFSLQGNNSGLTGGIVTNANSNNAAAIGALSGTLDFNGSALNVSTNQQNITLNGGTLNIRNNASITLTSMLTVNADATLNTDRISTGSGFAEGFNELIINNSTLTMTAGNTTSVIFQNSVSTNPSVLLTGNATFNTSTANLAIVGVISDGGGGFGITKAISGNTITLNTPSNVNIIDTYTGLTNILNGTLTITGTGTGVHSLTTNFMVAPSATLNLNSAGNVGGSNTIAVFSNNLGLGALGIGFNAALPTITGNSSGVLGINTTYNFVNLNLATIGNGTFFLGSTAGGTYSGTALTIGAGSIWRLGGGGNTLTISNNLITDANPVLIGAALVNGTGALANGGGTVAFSVAQTYTGTTTITSATVTYIDNTASNSTTAFTQTLTGNVILMGNATINAGGSAAFTSNYLLIKGQLIYGGNTLTFQNGVVALDPSAPAATGTGNTLLAGGVTLHLRAMNQLSPGNLQLSNGAFVLGKDDGTGAAPSWTQFMAFYTGGYGSGMNQWQITGSTGGFAAKGTSATILVNNATNSAYGYVTSQTLFDRDFRLGNDRRGNLTGLAGSQVFYADQPVILAQNTSLDAIRNISIAPTGPGVSGAPGTGVVNRISGNLSGFGAPHFQTFDTEQAPTGSNYTEASEVVLAGTNTWTGNPGNVNGVNAGAGGLILDQNVFVRFASNASLPTGNSGAPAFLAAIRDGQNNYGGGYLLTNGSTYTMPAGLSFLFGETVVGSGNSRTSILGSTSDSGGGGTATLQNANILIANTTGVTGGGLLELSPSNSQTLSLLSRDGTLNLGAGANAVTFQFATEYFYSNTNLYVGDGVLNSLDLGTASSVNSFGIADAQAGTGRRPLEKDGTGTVILNNVAYTFPVAGTTAATNFAWNIGDSITLGGTLQLGAANQIPAVAVNVVAGILDLNSLSTTITSLSMGGGPAGSTSTVNTETTTLTLGGNVTYNNTNNAGPATINGNLALGTGTRTFTVNHSTANTTDLTVNAVISGSGGLTVAGTGLLLLTAANTYTGTTTITAGTLVVGANAPSGAAGALGNATSAVLLGNTSGASSASLLIGGAFTVGRAVTVQAGNTGIMTLGGNSANASTFSGALTVSNTGGVMLTAAVGGSVTFSGVISGANPITAAGPGTVVLTNTGNTYTGVTTITGGILSISADRNLGNDPGTATAGNVVINGGTLQATATFTLNSNRGIALGPTSGTGTGTIDVTGGNTLTYGGIVANNATGTGGLVEIDAGTLVLTGTNTYTGTTTITGGVLSISSDANLGTAPASATAGALVINGGTLQATASFTLSSNRGIALGPTSGSGSGTIDVTGGNTLTYGGIIANNPTGSGSLILVDTGTLALSGASTYSGATNINNGTVQLGVANALPTTTAVVLGSGTTSGVLNLHGFNQTVAGVTTNGTGTANAVTNASPAATLTVTPSGTDTYAGLLSSNLALVMAGTGTLVLSNTSNSYSGGTTISAGTLSVPADTALGAASATLTINNAATFQTTQSFTTSRPVVLGPGGGIFDVAAGTTQTRTGVISSVDSTGSLGLIDTGTLALAAANTYGGGTLIAQGTLQLGLANALPTAGPVVLGIATFSGTLDLNGFNQTVNALAAGGSVAGDTVTNSSATAATLTINAVTAQTYAGLLSGNLALAKAGTATLTLGNTSNSYTGGTTINAGTLSVTTGTALGAANATLTINNGATYQTTQAFTSSRPVVLGPGGGIFDVAAGTTQTRTGVISSVDSTGSLTLTDSGMLVLSATNTYSGGTIINGGVLSVPSAAALGAANATLTINNGATYQTTQSFTTARPVVLGPNGGIFDVAAGTTQTDTGVISSVDTTGSLTLTDSGTLVLSATNTYSGGTIINAGVLSVPSAAALGAANATLTINNGTTYQTTQSFTTARPVVLGPGGGIFDVAAGTTQTRTGVISSVDATGSLTLIDSGTLVLNATNTYSGGTIINAGVLSVSSAAALGALTATLTINNGATYQTTASFTTARPVVLGPGGGVFDVATGTTQTRTGVISSLDATGSLTKTSAGTLALGVGNIYTGGTVINGGTLLANNPQDSATGSGAVSVNAGATFGGTGSVTGTVTVNGGTVSPAGSSIGTLTAGGANFSNGGALLIQVTGYGTAGTNYDQFSLNNTLTLGGTSTLTLDLAGLATTGTAAGFALYTSVVGTFAHVNLVNNPNNYTAHVTYNSISADVAISSLPPVNLHFKFNNPGNSPPPGYTSILPTTTYTAGQGYGWQNTTGLFAQDRHGPTPLLQDFIQGPDNTFLVDVPGPGTYVVNLTMGDLINPHGPVDIIANGVDEFGANPIQEIMGQYVTATFSVTITGTQLQLEIKRIGGDPFWAVNAIDIRTAPAGTITLSASPPTITGDGMSTSTISGTSSLPQGSLVTVSTSLGAITTADADPNYAGVQVMVGAGGAFSFVVRAPQVGGTANITAQEVTGAASGTTTLTITPPTTFHFKFNNPGNTAPSGYISVLPTTVFSAGGFGWQSTTGLFAQDRHGPTPLLRDFIQGPDNTFSVALANGTYLVNLTMGDLNNPHGPVDVIANGTDEFLGNLILEPQGQFVTPNFQVTVSSGQLNLEIKRVGGDPFWAVNAIDIVPASSAVGAITLMSSVATLNADGTSTATVSGTGAKPNSLITVTASLGTITTADAEPNYAGIQVQADGSGNFSFVIRAPNAAGGAVSITANDVTGAATGASSTILQVIPPSAFHFDFDYPYNVQTQTGYVSVLPTALFSAASGYGWNTTVAAQYRSSNPFLGTPGLENLQRDIHLAPDAIFKVLVHVTGVNHFSVTVYLGDNDHPHNAHVVIGGGAGTIDEGVVATGVDNPMSPMGGFAIMTYSIPASDFSPDGNGNDVLTIHLTGMATATDPGDNFFNANGLDVVASMTPSGDPGAGQGLGAPAVAARALPASLRGGSGTRVAATALVGTAAVVPSSTPALGLAALDVSEELSAAAADWGFLGLALQSPGRAGIVAPAAALANGQVGTGRPAAGSRTTALTETRSVGRNAAHHLLHQGLAAQGRNSVPLDVLDSIFTDMTPTE